MDVSSSTSDVSTSDSDDDYYKDTVSLGMTTIESRSHLSGLAGLRNLGNTCFMNSALQCLSHTPPLVQYILSKSYLKEVNEYNPLGQKGELVKAFGSLVCLLWKENTTCVVPRGFKRKLAQFAPQFSGYNQHDAQELLAFLLDGLHEDLNRVKEKKYVEEKEADGRPDHEVAKEAWEYYRARNNSFLVDHFQGMYKSTLQCPSCGKVSIKFDPFMYLSLPVPSSNMRKMSLMHIDISKAKLEHITVDVKSNGIVGDLLHVLRSTIQCNESDILIVEALNGYIHRRFDNTRERISDLSDDDDIIVFTMPKMKEGKFVNFVVHQRKAKPGTSDQNEDRWRPFAMPVVFSCAKDDLKHSKKIIKEKVNECLTKWGMLPVNAMDIDNQYEVSLTSEFGIGTTELDDDSISAEVDHQKHKDSTPLIHVGIDWSDRAGNTVDFNKFVAATNGTNSLDSHVKDVSLMSCIQAFLSKERLAENDMWHCPSCKKFVQAYKKLDLWTLPSVLVVHLKRFSYGASTFSRFYSSRGDKIDTRVNFPFEGLNLSDLLLSEAKDLKSYELFAVSNHYGGLGGGHYTAHVRHPDNLKWYYFNDQSVTSVTPEDVDGSSAYLLFYTNQRQEVNGHTE